MLLDFGSKTTLRVTGLSDKKKISLDRNQSVVQSAVIQWKNEQWGSLGHRPASVISFQMLKGGVSKTSTCLSLAQWWGELGFKVLCIDLDQQANLSSALGAESYAGPTWIDLIEQKNKITEPIIPVTENLDLLPSNLNNSVIEKTLIRSYRNWSAHVKQLLTPIKTQYDLILIDTAPSLSLLNTAVTLASDLIVLPITPEPFARLGLTMHMRELQDIEREFELDPILKRVVLTRYDSRERLSEEFLSQIEQEFSIELCDTFIRKSAEMNKALSENRSLLAQKSALREDYFLLALELKNILVQGVKNHALSQRANSEKSLPL